MDYTFLKRDAEKYCNFKNSSCDYMELGAKNISALRKQIG